MRPIDGQLSLMQLQTILEMIQSATREGALTQSRQEADTEKAKDIYQTTVTRHEEVTSRAIRDDDPRKDRERRHNPDEELGHEEQDEAPPSVDIVV